MIPTAIFFEFNQERDALLALDTLEELGYSPSLLNHTEKPTLHIHVEDQDLTSALEISQAHGGKLVEKNDSNAETEVLSMAYDLEGSIRIPAHVVNEDWTDAYANGPNYLTSDALPSEEEAAFDTSADNYDHFPPGVRL
jgi:hypothetical protein